MIKTKFFRSSVLGKLEEELNAFIEEKKISPQDIVKIYYNAVVTGPDDIQNTVIIVYKIPVPPQENEGIKLINMLVDKMMGLQEIVKEKDKTIEELRKAFEVTGKPANERNWQG